MAIRYNEDFWLHEDRELSLAELAELAGLAEQELKSWVDEGLLAPKDPSATQWYFRADRVVTIRQACRLRKDFELEPLGLGLVVQLLDRIDSLEHEVRALRARLPRGIP